MKRFRTLKSFQIFKIKKKKFKHVAVNVLLKGFPMIPLSCRSSLAGRYLYSGRGKFMPLLLESKILETPGSLVTDDIKMFPLWIWTLNLQPPSWYNMNCLEFEIILLPVPKVNKLSVPIFEEKKRFYHLWGEKYFFSSEEKCYLMGWGEYGVKSKDIVARVCPSQRAENM